MKNIILGFISGLSVIFIGIGVFSFFAIKKNEVLVPPSQPVAENAVVVGDGSTAGKIELTLVLPEPLEKNWDYKLPTLLGKIVEVDTAASAKPNAHDIMVLSPPSFPAKITVNVPASFIPSAADKPKERFRIDFDHCYSGFPVCNSKIRARADLPLNLAEELRLRSPIALGNVNFYIQIVNEDPKVKVKDCNAGQVQATIKIVSTNAMLKQMGAQTSYLLAITDESIPLSKTVIGSARINLTAKEVNAPVTYTAQRLEHGVAPRLIPCTKTESDTACIQKMQKFELEKRPLRSGPFIPGTTVIYPVAQNFVVGKCNINGMSYFAHAFGSEALNETLPPEIIYSR